MTQTTALGLSNSGYYRERILGDAVYLAAQSIDLIALAVDDIGEELTW
jgi:hypothetical protein